MTQAAQRKRLGFFTRVLEDAPAGTRYEYALAQIAHAEAHGFDTAWVAQHHFHEHEGGLPSPFVLLASAAARTRRIVLGTAIVTLPLEAPLRVAEDAAVLSLLSGGRFELGIGSGGTATSFPPFGFDPAERPQIFARHTEQLVSALRGDELTTDGGALYPAAPQLLDTLWQATFSAGGAARIGEAGFGLMLSKAQPNRQAATLADEQRPIVDAYLEALPDGIAPRVFGSRGLLVVDSEEEAKRWARRGVERTAATPGYAAPPSGASLDELQRFYDLHVGTPEQLVERLRKDHVLLASTDLVFQVHPVDPPHEVTLRSLELLATEVAPALGWTAAPEQASEQKESANG